MVDVSRREFLKLASGGAAGAIHVGTKTVDRLIPYVVAPEHLEPGMWTIYTTTCRECPAGCGMHLRHREGRIIKAEGNPDHPVSRGGLCPRGQSAPQGEYDPDRLRTPLVRNEKKELAPIGWDEALAHISELLRKSNGRIALLSDLQTGTLARLMSDFVKAFSSDRLVFHEPFNYEPLRRAHEVLFGRAEIPYYHLDRCEMILSFGADFLESWVSNVQFAWQFAAMHGDPTAAGRFAYVGPRLSMTAANADDLVLVTPDRMRAVAWAMLAVIVNNGWARQNTEGLRPVLRDVSTDVAGVNPRQIRDLARAFAQAKTAAALAGPVGAETEAAKDLAVAAGLLNYATGRIGQVVDFSRVHALGRTATREQMVRFLDELSPQDTLFIHNANPVYTWPEAAARIAKAGTVVYFGYMLDETAADAAWILPLDYPLESWGDYEPWTGIHELIQPTMRRLYDTRSVGDVLLALASAAGKPLPGPDSFQERLREQWRQLHGKVAPASSFEQFWAAALRRGGVWTEPPATATRPTVRLTGIQPLAAAPPPAGSVQFWAWPSVLLFDGRVANRGWLQEAPEPISCIVWGSCLDVHPRQAAALKCREGDLVTVQSETGSLTVPVRVTEDVAEGVAALAFGQGHTALGGLARGHGVNAFAVVGDSTGNPYFPAVRLERTGRSASPVYMYPTQHQYRRDILQWVERADLDKHRPDDEVPVTMPLPEGYSPTRDLHPPHSHKDHRWAMAVDLNRCIGCGACAVACYAENNIPVLGERSVRQGREMAWLKIVPYRHPDLAHRLGFLPMLCQHCDAAPCEPVCPVFAAVHNEQGLNNQVYNRCIGTRYCNNNCPYKVRRFNWFNIPWPDSLRLQLNPDVTVRCRGVMEKCTFCIQRITNVELQARKENRPVRDGEVMPACVQSCPTRAYVFGDLLDSKSEVSRIFRTHPRRYQVLHELNTKPAIVYLKRVQTEDLTQSV